MELTTEYRPEFAEIAFEKLSRIPLRDEKILCLVFRCNVQTLSLWKAENPGFAAAVELGLMSGEYKFRALLLHFALMPASAVNTKLLTLLASNVYNINEEQVKSIRAAFGDDAKSVEAQLKSYGIPIPVLEVPDIPSAQEIE